MRSDGRSECGAAHSLSLAGCFVPHGLDAEHAPANVIAIIERTCNFWVTRAMVRERDSETRARACARDDDAPSRVFSRHSFRDRIVAAERVLSASLVSPLPPLVTSLRVRARSPPRVPLHPPSRSLTRSVIVHVN